LQRGQNSGQASAFPNVANARGRWRAAELLAEGLPVTTIAIDLGYNNLSAIIAIFHRATGITPGRYFRSELQATNA
jgi:AraC-like DNA-binding protein